MPQPTTDESYCPWAESLVQSRYRNKPTTTVTPLVTQVNVVYKPLRGIVQVPTEEGLGVKLIPFWYLGDAVDFDKKRSSRSMLSRWPQNAKQTIGD